jgi:threonine/homoserine/homoserine lactone efflux protein
MDVTAALIAGLAAGIVIAMQVGAVSLLVVETAVTGGVRVGVAAGLGVATADLAFGAVAAVAGGTAGAVLSEHEAEIRLVAATTLVAIALHGLAALRRSRAERAAADAEVAGAGARGHYLRFLAITSVNPLTIASFAAVATSLPLGNPAAATAFAAGVGGASAGWHVALTVAAGHAGRWITPRVQNALAVGGRVGVLLLAAHLALGA